MTEGRHITDAKSFLECFAACLRDAGVDVSRITTGVPVLHQQLFSVSSLWERDKGVTERPAILKVARGLVATRFFGF
jgi:adenylate cyclase